MPEYKSERPAAYFNFDYFVKIVVDNNFNKSYN